MTNKSNNINEFINLVNLKVRLSDFISQFINLSERGNSYVGKCPFHNENTPSFNVNNEKGLFYCFGCKAGGNIITFTKKYKNFTFNEAVNYISEYTGVKLSNNTFLNKDKHNQLNQTEIKILKACNDFFKECYVKNKKASDYLKKRVSDEVINTFQVGFCPEHHILENFLKNNNFFEDDYQKLDLFIKNKKGEIFGRFSNRITFPIFDYGEKIVGFGGRTINNSKIKYINSQESQFFKKSNILFGLKQNLDFIRAKKEIFLVEGYLDVIKLHEFQIKNSVSSLGTTLSENQLKKLWYYTDIPFVCFDGDQAGVNAAKNVAIKSLSFLIPGKSLKFIILPNNLDPDQFLSERGKEDFLELKNDSLNLSELIWSLILDEISELTPEFIATIDQKIEYYVSKISNNIVAKEYSRFLKNKKDKFLWKNNSFSKSKTKILNQPKVIENLNEKILITILITEKKIFMKYFEEISNLKLRDNNLEKKKNEIFQLFSENNFDTKNDLWFENLFSENELNEIKSLKSTHIEKIEEKDKEIFFHNIINNIRLPNLIKERELVREELLSNNDNSSKNLILRFQNLNNEINKIQNKKIE
ncbi:MAG: DNA primase [Alphaproteobacteria bacterium]